MKIKIKGRNLPDKFRMYVQKENEFALYGGKDKFIITITGTWQGKRIQFDFDPLSRKKYKKLVYKMKKL